MIRIKCAELGTTIDQMKRVVEEYEQNTREIHWIFEELSHYWWSNKTKDYYMRIQENELDIQKVVYGLRKELVAFEVALMQYEKFGDVIECDIESKDYILRRYDSLIGRIENTMYDYSHLTVPEMNIRSSIDAQNQRLKREAEKLATIKGKTRLQVEKIELIENQLRNSLRDISEVKTEADLTFEEVANGEFSSQSAFDLEKSRLASSQLEPRLADETSLIQKLKFFMNEIPRFYDTPTMRMVREINQTFILSLERIAENNRYFKRYIDENSREYQELIEKNIQNLEEQ